MRMKGFEITICTYQPSGQDMILAVYVSSNHINVQAICLLATAVTPLDISEDIWRYFQPFFCGDQKRLFVKESQTTSLCDRGG